MMRVSRFARVSVGLAAVAVLLSGCGRDPLGLSDKRPPDEFTVVSRAPLVVPPNYALRPPQPGAPRPQDAQPSEQARALMFQRQIAASDASAGERVLLDKAGAENADPNIRETVNLETSRLQNTGRGLADYILFWQTPADPNTVVNAPGEAERLRKAQTDKQPVTGEGTPVIQRAVQRTLF
ncbi:MAG: DUF3035 domain-containing protein [Alphaproteobacteria bacterium]|nr:DUF3035 domain-containing protein [Alphaproteobacteria bacterium]MDX5368656.1 DUF3035 domain-containing protein [Alphaproteobacteria bacterium]MDX5463401.1 DUF3035 domain-containing protein [Alphaproteobacteria bacterium]